MFHTILLILFLTACGSVKNNENKPLDASSPYCKELREQNTKLYYEACESVAGWEQRDPDGYKEAKRGKGIIEGTIDNAVDDLIDAAIEDLTGNED